MNTTCVHVRKFWLVLNTKRKEAPQQKHWTLDAAITEAKRLSSMQPQDEFVVLGAEYVIFQPSKVYVIRLETAEQTFIRLSTPPKSLDEDLPTQVAYEPPMEPPYDPPDDGYQGDH